MPFGDFTIPSSRRVPTCNPALPGGRFAPARAAASCRLVSDSNGSRRDTLDSSGAAGELDAAEEASEAVAAAGFCADLVADFFAAFGAGAGAVWASKLLPAVASINPVTIVMARRMARSSLLTVFSPAGPQLHPWARLRRWCQLAS